MNLRRRAPDIKPRPGDGAVTALATLIDSLEAMKTQLVAAMTIAAACGALLGVLMGGALVWAILG